MKDKSNSKQELLEEIKVLKQKIKQLEHMESESKRAEEALRESDGRFRELAELLPETVYETDTQGTLTFVNRNALDRFGYTPQNFARGLNSLDMVVPEDRGRALENFQRVINGEHVASNEYTFRRRDGSIFPAIIHSTVIIHDGKPAGLRGIMIDNSRQKRIDAALRESEGSYRRLFESSPAAIYQVDFRTGKFLKANDIFCDHFGCGQEEITSHSPFDLLTDESKQLLSERLNKIFLGKKVSEAPEYEVIDKNGRRLWFQLSSKNIYDSEGLMGADVVAHDITERKQAEEALRESEEKYRAVVERAYDCIAIVVDGIIRFSNSAFKSVLGYEKDEVDGMKLTMFSPPECLDAVVDRYRRRIAGEKLSPLWETTLLHKNGTKVMVESSGGIIQFKGKPADLIFIRDITDRKLMEEALQRAHDELEQRVAERTEELMLINKELREETAERKRAKEALFDSEWKYRTLIENIQDGIYILDSFGNFTFVNDVVVKRSGLPAEWFLGRSCLDVIIKEDRERVQRYFNKVMNGEIQLFDLSYQTKFGDLLHVEVSTAPIFDGTRVIALLGISRDISERRHLEDALVKSEEKLRLIAENMVDCVALVDASGTYQFVTPSYKEILGYGSEEMVGISGFSLLHPDDLERVLKLYMNGIEQGLQAIHYEARLRNSDGRYVSLEVRARSLKDTEGKITGGVLAARDITERRQAEEELEKYRKQLEDMVKERTSELENKNITLQELNTALRVLLKQREDDKKEMEERFVLNIRNLVLPYVERIKKGPLDVAQRPYLDIIEAHLNEIATPLLKNLRQFNLTPKEMKVAVFVRQGKSTKGIAEILRISTGSIDIHRKNIRKKLGLSNRKANLQSQLENFDQ